MQVEKYSDFLKEKKMTQMQIQEAIDIVVACQDYMEEVYQIPIDDLGLDHIKAYIRRLIELEHNTVTRFLSLARYFYVIDRKDIYIFFTGIFGSLGVIEEIEKRIIQQLGPDKHRLIFDGLILPRLGEALEDMPKFIDAFMKALHKHLGLDEIKKVLAGNNHQLSIESMLGEREAFLKSENLDRYLKERHERKVNELLDHMRDGKVWFEQIITKEVVEFVAANQEILSAVRQEDALWITKIPYDTKGFIEAQEASEKRYYACHCPFVRAGLRENQRMDPNWCYCSGGFAKFPFEVMFDEELEVELIDSPLKGDLMCRFKVTIPKTILQDFVK